LDFFQLCFCSFQLHLNLACLLSLNILSKVKSYLKRVSVENENIQPIRSFIWTCQARRALNDDCLKWQGRTWRPVCKVAAVLKLFLGDADRLSMTASLRVQKPKLVASLLRNWCHSW
jgi:hypothetical protein